MRFRYKAKCAKQCKIIEQFKYIFFYFQKKRTIFTIYIKYGKCDTGNKNTKYFIISHSQHQLHIQFIYIDIRRIIQCTKIIVNILHVKRVLGFNIS